VSRFTWSRFSSRAISFRDSGAGCRTAGGIVEDQVRTSIGSRKNRTLTTLAMRIRGDTDDA
jgi:hypothetical protein